MTKVEPVYLSKGEADFISNMADKFIEGIKDSLDDTTDYQRGQTAQAEKIKLYLEQVFKEKK